MNREFGSSIICWWNVVGLRTGQGQVKDRDAKVN